MESRPLLLILGCLTDFLVTSGSQKRPCSFHQLFWDTCAEGSQLPIEKSVYPETTTLRGLHAIGHWHQLQSQLTATLSCQSCEHLGCPAQLSWRDSNLSLTTTTSSENYPAMHFLSYDPQNREQSKMVMLGEISILQVRKLRHPQKPKI